MRFSCVGLGSRLESVGGGSIRRGLLASRYLQSDLLDGRPPCKFGCYFASLSGRICPQGPIRRDLIRFLASQAGHGGQAGPTEQAGQAGQAWKRNQACKANSFSGYSQSGIQDGRPLSKLHLEQFQLCLMGVRAQRTACRSKCVSCVFRCEHW